MKILMGTEVDDKGIVALLRRTLIGYCVTIKDPVSGGECCLTVKRVETHEGWLVFSGLTPEPKAGECEEREICVEIQGKGEATGDLEITYH